MYDNCLLKTKHICTSFGIVTLNIKRIEEIYYMVNIEKHQFKHMTTVCQNSKHLIQFQSSGIDHCKY